MKIKSAQVIVCSPARNFVTLRIETEDGLVGLGDATLNGRELAVAAYLEQHLVPLLEGRDARKIEDTWQYLYRGAYWRRGPVTMTAIGAVDQALWDIAARSMGVPLYRLLGGASRDGVLVYKHATGDGVDAVIEDAQRLLAGGFRALRIQSSIPGLERCYGVSDKKEYEPAARSALGRAEWPHEEPWDTRAYLRFAPELFARVRAALGPEPVLLHDVHHRLTPTEAAHLGKALEPYDLFWLEDPTPSEWPEAFLTIRAHTTIPIATGEIWNTIHEAHTLVAERLIDFVRIAPSHGGGLTPLRKIAALAELHQVKMACHGPSDISPVALAAALHFDLAVHNLGIQEWMGHPNEVQNVFKAAYRFEDGFMHPGDAPGLGVDFDLKAAARYPYHPAYLPVARLGDGTLHDW